MVTESGALGVTKCAVLSSNFSDQILNIDMRGSQARQILLGKRICGGLAYGSFRPIADLANAVTLFTAS
jgi:hypothetical protein